MGRICQLITPPKSQEEFTTFCHRHGEVDPHVIAMAWRGYVIKHTNYHSRHNNSQKTAGKLSEKSDNIRVIEFIDAMNE